MAQESGGALKNQGFGRPADSGEWEPIELELVRDGYMARVSRTMKPGRWRWCVAAMDHVVKWNRLPTEYPSSKGFTGSRERAMEMAEAAIAALKKSEPKTKS